MADAFVGDEFLDAMAPVCELLSGVVDACAELPNAIPMADSPAMAEIAQQYLFQSEWWTEPVETALSAISIRLVVVCDALETYGSLFRSDPVPVFAHLPIARMGLDAAGAAYWLAEAVGAAERVKRAQALALQNGKEMKRSPFPEAKANGVAALERVTLGAAHVGWDVNKGDRPHVGGTSVPRARELIGGVMATALGGAGLADRMWSYLSGVTHGYPWALLQAGDHSASRPSVTGGVVVPMATDSLAVTVLGLTLARVLATVVGRHSELIAWSSQEWNAAHGRLLQASEEVSRHITGLR